LTAADGETEPEALRELAGEHADHVASLLG